MNLDKSITRTTVQVINLYHSFPSLNIKGELQSIADSSNSVKFS